jgi:hypothetical protein
LLGFLAWITIHAGFDDTNIQNAQAYADGAYDVFEATVEERGYQYSGDCSTWGHGVDYKECDAGEAVDADCAWATGRKYPLGAPDTARRLSDTCTDSYVPWLVVGFEADGKKVKRCAYTYGTARNSVIHRWEVAKGFHETASPTKVWADATRCVVGVWDRSEIVPIEQRNDRNSLVQGAVCTTLAVIGLFSALYACCADGEKGEKGEEHDELASVVTDDE